MPATWQTIHARGQQTVAVWGQYSPAFTVGALTLASHNTKVASLPNLAQDLETAEDAVDGARAARDAQMAAVRDLSIRMPRRLEGEIAVDDPLHEDIAGVRGIDPESLTAIEARGKRVVSLWEKANAARAAAVPPLGPLLIGATTAAQFKGLVDGLPALEQTVEDERSDLSTARTALHGAMRTVDADNKRWYAAWEGNFAAGSPEREALSQIDTGSGTPPPTALIIAAGTRTAADTITLDYAPGSGANATLLQIFWRLPGEVDFPHGVDANPPQQVLQSEDFALGAVVFRTRAMNSTGEALGPELTVDL